MTKEEIDFVIAEQNKSTAVILEAIARAREDSYMLPKDLLGLWEQTVCEIRSEIKAQDTPALVYVKELCDKLEQSMCALAGGPYNLTYSITD